jgi:hypothetical protein
MIVKNRRFKTPSRICVFEKSIDIKKIDLPLRTNIFDSLISEPPPSLESLGENVIDGVEESKENNTEPMDYEPVIINIPEEIPEPEPIPAIIPTTIFEPINIVKSVKKEYIPEPHPEPIIYIFKPDNIDIVEEFVNINIEEEPVNIDTVEEPVNIDNEEPVNIDTVEEPVNIDNEPVNIDTIEEPVNIDTVEEPVNIDNEPVNIDTEEL